MKIDKNIIQSIVTKTQDSIIEVDIAPYLMSFSKLYQFLNKRYHQRIVGNRSIVSP